MERGGEWINRSIDLFSLEEKEKESSFIVGAGKTKRRII